MKREEDRNRVQVRPYSKLDETQVKGYTRANGNKRKILKEERKLKTDSKDLVRDTKDNEFNKAQYDLERIDTTSAELKPELPVADKKHRVKMEERAAKQKARAEKRARRKARKEEKQKLKDANADTRVSEQSPRFMSQQWKAQRLSENQAAWHADEEKKKREAEIKREADEHNAKLGYKLTPVSEEQARKIQFDKDRKDAKDPKGAGYV
jgi:hypothetical protein